MQRSRCRIRITPDHQQCALFSPYSYPFLTLYILLQAGSAFVDALTWVKPGGECDGTSDQSSPRYDAHCGQADATKVSFAHFSSRISYLYLPYLSPHLKLAHGSVFTIISIPLNVLTVSFFLVRVAIRDSPHRRQPRFLNISGRIWDGCYTLKYRTGVGGLGKRNLSYTRCQSI